MHASNILAGHLKRRPPGIDTFLHSLYGIHVLPDVESSTTAVSRSLHPALHNLKWSIQRDRLAKLVRSGSSCSIIGGQSITGAVGFGAWLEQSGKGIVQDSERVRLALCPNAQKTIAFYESLGKSK